MGRSTEEPLATSMFVQQDSQHKKSLHFASGSREVRYHCTGAKWEDDNIPKQYHSLDCVINRPIKKQCLNSSLTVQNWKREQLKDECDAWYQTFKPSGFTLVCIIEMLTYQLSCVQLLRTKNYCLIIFICVNSFSNQFPFSGLDWYNKLLCKGKAQEMDLAEKHEYAVVEAHLPHG